MAANEDGGGTRGRSPDVRLGSTSRGGVAALFEGAHSGMERPEKPRAKDFGFGEEKAKRLSIPRYVAPSLGAAQILVLLVAVFLFFFGEVGEDLRGLQNPVLKALGLLIAYTGVPFAMGAMLFLATRRAVEASSSSR